ncbi:unnamed protein product, partial [Allacma fusca]
SSFIDFTRSEA